jgi:cytochrome P450
MTTDATRVTFDPFSPETVVNPYATYQLLRDYAPVFYNAERDFWALSRFQDVQDAARDHHTFSSAAGVDLDYGAAELIGSGNFNGMDPPDHRALRGAVRESFSPHRITELTFAVEAEIARLLAGLEGRNVIDAAEDYSQPLPARMIVRILGLPLRDAAHLSRLLADTLSTGRQPGESGIPQVAREATADVRAYLAVAIEGRRRAPRDDMLSAIANAAWPDGRLLSVGESVGMAMLLGVAGTVTTRTLIATALLLLAQHPEQREAVRVDPSLWPAVVEETLRFESPFQNHVRTTTRDIVLHDTHIPAGARVVLLWGAANRDERRWEAADRFDIHREPKRHLAFGEGVHFCVGAPLARLEAPLALEAFMHRYPNYEIAGSVRRTYRVNERGVESLPVRLNDDGATVA